LFDHHGYQAMKLCRDFGFQDASAKRSLTLSKFQELLNKNGNYPSSIAESLEALNVSPIEYYLKHRGFGVRASENEMRMARLYLVYGLTYPSAEERVGICRKRGFAAMYAVCKLGGFRGMTDRKSMTESDFNSRAKFLSLVSDDYRGA
jgi:hypothetical protein